MRIAKVLGRLPSCSLIADVTGRADGTPQVKHFVISALSKFTGIADDDSSEHCWTANEVAIGAKIDGLSFFDYREIYRRTDGTSGQK